MIKNIIKKEVANFKPINFINGTSQNNDNHTFSCQICFKHFKTENQKINHEKKHNKKARKFICKICPSEVFSVEEEYLTHIDDVHKGRQVEKFMCSECGKQYKSKHDLTIHNKSKCGTRKIFECQECNKKFMTPGSLYNHKLSHKGAPSYMCRYCAKLFLTSGQLKIHERSHTKEKVFICNICGKGFCHRQSLITHNTIHTGIKPFVCENCECSFSCVGNLLKHRKTRADTCGLIPLKTHRINHPETKVKIKLNMTKNLKLHALGKNKKIYKANLTKVQVNHVVMKNSIQINVVQSEEKQANNYINRISESNSNPTASSKFLDVIINENEVKKQTKEDNSNISKHSNKFNTTEHPNKPASCKNEIGALNKDLNIEKTINSLDCKYCSKTYKNSKWLKRHEEQHNESSEGDSINCRYCSLNFSEKEEYKTHQLKAHSDILSCIQCDKIFANVDSLRCHKRTIHHGVERKSYVYICEKCGVGFKQKSYLEIHKEKNCDLGPFYECSICQKKLINQHVLKSHMLIHSPEKRLVCKYCGKKFRWKGQLNIHERSHTGEKPYACLYCSKSFLYRESLLTHSTLHTGIKPFLCKACGLRFSCLSNLLSHKVTHASTCGEWYKKNQCEEKKNKES